MSPSRRVHGSALVLSLVVLLGAVPRVSAQFYEDARRGLALSPDPLARSPRLLGMGRLSLVVEDQHNRISLWDFAGNPTGVLDADSSTTLELGPSTTSVSSVHDRFDVQPQFERQDLAAREFTLAYETWLRQSESFTFGAIGDVGDLRLDRPFTTDLERRSRFSRPNVMPILAGKMPRVLPDRMRYALRMAYATESFTDQYRQVVRNAAGEYLDLDGPGVDPPDEFTPDDYTIRTLGGGAAVAMRFGDGLTAAAGYDRIGNRIKGDNSGPRHHTERTEKRPYNVGQISLVGRLGAGVEWGADGRGWNSSSEENWFASISAGSGADPLAGRGKVADREENGTSLRTRARWAAGVLEFGAGFNAASRRVETRPAPVSEPGSFNAFRSEIYFREGADTLTVPEEIIFNVTNERAWEAAAGVAWMMPNHRGAWGLEGHRVQSSLRQHVGGLGPKRVVSDLRTGLEYRPFTTFAGRMGYIYRWGDEDELTANNEYRTHTGTVGLGLSPEGARWRLEAGYALEWMEADYGDPGKPRSNRQQLSTRVRWDF